MLKRTAIWLSLYAKGLWDELTHQSGALAVAALIVTAGALTDKVPARPILLTLGWLLAATATILALHRSRPDFPKSIKNAATSGADIPLEELSLYKDIPRVAIVGVPSVGKSTLKDWLLNEEHVDEVSSSTGGRAIRLGRDDKSIAIVLDGPGGSIQRQYDMAEMSDVICVVLDHSIAQDGMVSEMRLGQQANFFGEMRSVLSAEWQKVPPKKQGVKVHILLNKSDLWKQSGPDGQRRLFDFLESERIAWASTRHIEPVTVAHHSNTLMEDMINVRSALNPFTPVEVK